MSEREALCDTQICISTVAAAAAAADRLAGEKSKTLFPLEESRISLFNLFPLASFIAHSPSICTVLAQEPTFGRLVPDNSSEQKSCEIPNNQRDAAAADWRRPNEPKSPHSKLCWSVVFQFDASLQLLNTEPSVCLYADHALLWWRLQQHTQTHRQTQRMMIMMYQ